MEKKEFNAVIISAYGSGDWLAVEMKNAGMQVLLLDVTSQLGNWPFEDAEGPFGFFKQEKYTASFLERFSHFDRYEDVEQGLTLWLADGPLELKSSLTAYRLTRLGLHSQIQELFSQCLNQPTSALIDKINALPFSESWLLPLACQMASTTYRSNRESLSAKDRVLPLLNSFALRSISRDAYQQSLSWVRKKGVTVITDAEILDLAFQSRSKISGIELKGKTLSGLVRLEQLIWTLSSEETYHLNEKLGSILFPKGILESQWCWLRYRLKVKDCLEMQNLPIHVCILNDVYSPWTHENFAILQKTAVKENMDAWMRLPTVQRFNKEYLSKHGTRLVESLLSRMPLCGAEIQTYPQEYYYTYKDLGAPRIPVYAEANEKQRKWKIFKNLQRDGVEMLPNFSWDAAFDLQNQILQKAVQEWKQIQLQLQKQRKETHP